MLDRCRPSLLLALALPVLAGAYDDGCVITITPLEPGEGCVYEGQEHELADSFPAGDGCNSCTCTEAGVMCTRVECEPPEPPGVCDGEVVCRALPPECRPGFVPSIVDGCWGECVPEELCEGPPTGCFVDGERIPPGQFFGAPDGCNTCFCGEDGSIACTEMACEPPGDGSCALDGERYLDGERILLDECTVCECSEGQVLCEVTTDCVQPTCEYAGRPYELGDTFPSEDGCNECGCTEHGVLCTRRACDAPDLQPEPFAVCDGEVVCRALPPECEEGSVPSIVDGCWGECVPVEHCG